jgi:hypothetical protein
VAQAEVAGHVLTAQVEVAVGEPEVFVGNLVVELEREDLGGVENVERAGDEWMRPYSRTQADWPAPWLRQHKFWPSIARIDNVHGDRHIFCSCPPMASA